jgi:hypothetical protein
MTDPATAPLYEAIVKVNVRDPEKRRAKDIADGIGYAICLLQDEYGWSADQIECEIDFHLENASEREHRDDR